jgi:hypothetical protein
VLKVLLVLKGQWVLKDLRVIKEMMLQSLSLPGSSLTQQTRLILTGSFHLILIGLLLLAWSTQARIQH